MLDDSALDDLLRELRPEQPTAALRERIIAAAPTGRTRRPGRRLWWSLGAGWAVAGVAGLVLGSALAPTNSVSDIDQAFASEDGVWPEDLG